MAIPEAQIEAMCDELQKIAGGAIGKALMTNITPGSGPILRRLGRGFKNVGHEVARQVKKEGLRGLF